MAWVLIVSLAVPVELCAQQPPISVPAATPPPAATVIESLKILVLEGEGAINAVDRNLHKPAVVEIRDQNDRPVEGAEVVFRLPPTGPGGYFPGQKASRTVKSNLQGQAVATGFAPNKETGRFKIHVTATYGNQIGETDISQTNALQVNAVNLEKPPKKFGWWKIAALGGGGVLAAVLIIVATRGNSDQTITIVPGPVTIGGR